MTDYVVTWDPGQLLPNGYPADEAYMLLEAVDLYDLGNKIWDLLGEHRGDNYHADDARDATRGRWEVLPGEWFTVEECTSCHARVIRTMRTGNMTTAFVDAAPDTAGTVTLTRNAAGRIPLVRTLTVTDRFGRKDLRTLHRCGKRHGSKGVHS